MKSKRCKCSSKYYDRLSEMPDEVIVHILSYLPIVDAVRTMLIRPFRNLWTLLPILKFKAEYDGTWRSNDVERFCIFVRNVLMLHKRPVLDKFHILLAQFDERKRSEAGDDIRMWLRFALDKQAKEIYFDDFSSYLCKSSDFPNFTSQSLVTLELSYCRIYPQLQVNLGSLKKLILCETDMCEKAFQQLICGCPSLQELHIEEPKINKLRFSAPNIHKLFLVFKEENYFVNQYWSLDVPNLKSLDLKIDWIPEVIDVSSIQDVYLKSLYDFADDEKELRMFNIFLEKFSRCEVFQLSLDASEPFLHLIDDLHLLQIRWKRLVLRLRIFCESCFLGVYQLMRSSKDLEELDIYTDTTLTYTSVCNTSVYNTHSLFSDQAFKETADLPTVELSHPCVMPKLKTVTLHGYTKPWKHQLELVEFLLKSASVLEKLVIVPNECGLSAVEKLDFVMHVSNFQRSSPNARVRFL